MGTKTALCIGINDYPGKVNDLSGCINDANDWAAELTARGFKVGKLLNRKATKKAILGGMKNLIDAAASGDTIVFTFSGHGSFQDDLNGDEPDGVDECLCPCDIGSNAGIVDDELAELFSSVSPKGVKLVFISDSCHSGTVAKFMISATPPAAKGTNIKRPKTRFLPPANFLSKARLAKLGNRRNVRTASPPGRKDCLLIAGCQDPQSSIDDFFLGRPNGAFTFFALQALKKMKASASYDDWFKAIRKSLPSAQHNQTPNLFGTPTMKKWKIFQ